MKKVAVIHTSFVTVDLLKRMFEKILPEVQMINIVDDGLLAEVTAHNGPTPSVIRRVCHYALEAQDTGADAVFNQCSSVGEAVDVARSMLRIPYVKIDEAMMEQAVLAGERVALVATAASTVGPSSRLLEKTAQRLGRKARVQAYLADGALKALMGAGGREVHDRMVLEQIALAEREADVIVLAQGSMATLAHLLGHVEKPVLTSPLSGVENLKKTLGL